MVMAMSGLLYITGKPDAPPVRISFPQSFLLASAHAAAASLIAYFYREKTGQGQHVDVSAQECVLWELSNAVPLWELNHKILKRAGSYLSGRWTDTKQKLLWRCKDGYVIFYILGGDFGLKTNRAIAAWLQEEGLASELHGNFRLDCVRHVLSDTGNAGTDGGTDRRAIFEIHKGRIVWPGPKKKDNALPCVHSSRHF